MKSLAFRAALIGLALLGLMACGRTKEDMVSKARGATTRTELERALGRPSDVAKIGPVERWVYKGSDGDVIFVIVGDAVTLQATEPGDKK
ncbi:MAG TPA: hypothetical protein VEL75_08405 [Candidatus Methylomirabilis sp.]|nr:hypothetical protein [Candidatus Methylomirabilis sp.]